MKYLILSMLTLLLSCQKSVEKVEKKNTDSSNSPVQVVKEHKSDIEKKNTDSSSVEKFEIFFKKFSSDPKFQISRVKFPLEIYDYEVGDDGPDTDTLETSTLEKNQWEFSKLYSKKFLKNIKKLDSNNYMVEIQVYDTGIFVEYYFTMENNKWFLIKIVDRST